MLLQARLQCTDQIYTHSAAIYGLNTPKVKKRPRFSDSRYIGEKISGDITRRSNATRVSSQNYG